MDLVGIGGLGEIVDRPEFDRGHGGGDVAVAGQDDHPRIGPALADELDDVEAVAVLQPKVDDGECRRGGIDLAQAFGDGIGGIDREAARLHGAGQPLQERLVVVDDEKGHAGSGSGPVFGVGHLNHGLRPLAQNVAPDWRGLYGVGVASPSRS